MRVFINLNHWSKTATADTAYRFECKPQIFRSFAILYVQRFFKLFTYSLTTPDMTGCTETNRNNVSTSRLKTKSAIKGGNAVNLAARLENLANSGGVCVSESVRSELEDNSAFNFVALGKQYVKNISEPVQAFWSEIDAQQVVDADFTSSLKVSVMAS